MISSPTFYSIIEYLYISSKCVSGANETNCALNVMSPTGLRNSPSPGLAGPFARSEGISSAGKAGCSLADSPGKSPPRLPATREFAGRECLSAAGKAQAGSPGRILRSSRTHGVYGPRVGLNPGPKPLWYKAILFKWNRYTVMRLWWNKMQNLHNVI